VASRTPSTAGSGLKNPRKHPVARQRERLDSRRNTRLLAALAEPQRLRIVQSLENSPGRCVGEICRALDLPLANVSYHLQFLRNVGLVRRERRGRNILYSLAPALFRPPMGGAPAAIDLGHCRLELGHTVEVAIAAHAPRHKSSQSGGRRRAGSAAPQTGDLRVPHVEGRWVGQWEPSDAAHASAARGKGRKEIVCVVEARDGIWHATFEGESGHPYKYSIEMEGRMVGGAILFKGSIDLGEANGGVFDWLGRADDQQFVGYYSSAHYTGVFSLGRADAD
jgi:DNA-binding transcriptional ArsR family regulator